MKRTGKTYALRYDSLQAFAADAAERSDTADCWGGYSLNTSAQFGQFSGCASLDDALALARDGWSDGTARLVDGLAAVDTSHDVRTAAYAAQYDVAGMAPDVAAYCAGEPEHMMTFEPVDDAAPVVRIVCNGSYSHNTSTDTVTNFGVALLSQVRALQTAGRSVELYWCDAAQGRPRNSRAANKTAVQLVKLCDPLAPIDIDVLAFALLHPSMLRRLSIAIREQRSELNMHGYGAPLPLEHKAVQPLLPDGAIMMPCVEQFADQTVSMIGQTIAARIAGGR